jgi:hypothetical protein
LCPVERALDGLLCSLCRRELMPAAKIAGRSGNGAKRRGKRGRIECS